MSRVPDRRHSALSDDDFHRERERMQFAILETQEQTYETTPIKEAPLGFETTPKHQKALCVPTESLEVRTYIL
jgi:hypothetical protein